MITIGRNQKTGIMDKGITPAAYCRDEDIVCFETMDCSDGAVSVDGSRDYTEGKYIANPATGPLYVYGVHPGDILKVSILDIQTAAWGYMGTGFDCDCFKNIMGEKELRTFDISDGKVHIGTKMFDVRPMIGVIGVAPEKEGVNTVTPDAHGGNMDCKLITKGADVFFPVFTEGALLSMGDLHAVMGDGEVFQYGLEVSGSVIVKIHIIHKENQVSMPLVRCDGKLWALGSAKTLEESSTAAVQQIYRILVSNGWNPTEAGYLMSMMCDLAICQTVDPNVTVRAGIPLELICNNQK